MKTALKEKPVITKTRNCPPMFSRYRLDDFYDEMVCDGGDIRSWYQFFTDSMSGLGFSEVVQRQRAAEKAFMSMGITFNVYRDGAGLNGYFLLISSPDHRYPGMGPDRAGTQNNALQR